VEIKNNNPMRVFFNTGRGKWDQHGKPENESLCTKCSMDYVQDDYDFTANRPIAMREVYELIRNNDISGARISRHPYNLRELMTALSFKYRDDPQLVLDWLSLAFCGVYEGCKKEFNINKIFDPQVIKRDVALFLTKNVENVRDFEDISVQEASQKFEWFENIMKEAIGILKEHLVWAKRCVAKAEELGKIKNVFVPALSQRIRVIMVRCDSPKTAAFARSKGYNVVIQINKSGHVQVHGGCLKETTDGHTIKKWINMSWVAKELRFWEARFRGVTIAESDWTISDVVHDTDGKKIPWYLPEFLTSLYNGTMSSRDVSPTQIRDSKMFEIICKAFRSDRCEMLTQIDDGPREIVEKALV
jgi:hypothetical protein